MEEVVAAGQAGGTRRPARVSRHRTGRRASEEADDMPPGTGEGGNRPATDSREEGGLAAEDDDDSKYLGRMWGKLMAWSVLFVSVKAMPIIDPPAWLSTAREAGAGEQQLQAARLYSRLSALALVQDAAIAFHLGLSQLKLVPAGRARAGVARFMVAGLVSSVLAVAACVAGARSSEDWRGMAPTFTPLVAAAGVVVLAVLGKLKGLLSFVGG